MSGNDRLLEVLKRTWGYDSFRPLQREAVEASLSGRDCLVILPTGGGKSLCFQVPAALGEGAVLVISPLIALMDDQVAAAREAGLQAVALHSNLGADERRRAYGELQAGRAELIYASPERLCTGDLLPRIQGRLRLITVDEAHCISQWGHDFRPEYRQLAAMLESCGDVPRLALTATATPKVQQDIVEQLGLRDPLRLVGHVDRPNLLYRSLARRQPARQVLDVMARHPGEGGIVYCQTRTGTERLAEKLREAGASAEAYHAGLDAGRRSKTQRSFLEERLDVVVATIAFGMGIDRSNVRFVVHANLPKSIEHYQQESGRAGRDGLPAECVLLHSYSDIATHRHLAEMDGPLPADRKAAFERQIRDIGRYAVAPICRHQLLAEHFGQSWPPPGRQNSASCGACDVCLGETRELPAGEALLAAQKILCAVERCRNTFGVGHVVDVLLGRDNERIRRHGHDQLSTFALLKNCEEVALHTWIDQLVLQGSLVIDNNEGFPIVRTTPTGLALCKQGGAVRLSVVEKSVRAPRRGGGTPTATQPENGAPDDALFQRLRELRRALAQRAGQPAYLVFSDASLREMARLKPADEAAFLTVKGVGESKCRRYGHIFLAAITGRPLEELLREDAASPKR